MAIKSRRIGNDKDVNHLNQVETVNPFWDPAVPTTAIPKWSVVFVSGVQGVKMKVQKAGGAHVAATGGFVMIAEHELREGGTCTTGWALVDFDTTGASINDEVYLAGNGTVALAGTVQIGHVLSVGTDGQVLLNPRMVA